MRRTLHIRPLIFNFLKISTFLGLFIGVSGCALFSSPEDSPDKLIERASRQKIFYAPYDLVWKAAHTAIRYTISMDNQDYGVIETDYIKAVDGFLRPDQTRPKYKSGRYKLIFNFAKGMTNGKESTRVTIDKRIDVFRDFISETRVESSDGLEELTIFYRIEREIIIANALKKAGSLIPEENAETPAQ